MEVKPQYTSVGKLFAYQPVYRVPAYQRTYSWEQLEIEDFLRDLENCYNKRKYVEPVVHFFGQIVCIESKLQASYEHPYFELVDGQQRVATFVLLVTSIINIYKRILAEDIGTNTALRNERGILEGRVDALSKRYIQFPKEVQDNFQNINVLELSNRDKTFFNGFIQNVNTVADKESHILVKHAYRLIETKVSSLTLSTNLKDRIGNLKTVEQILEIDFCVLNMITSDRKSAYRLFQVLNNRGKNLTEGDLLRAESLRVLEQYTTTQTAAEESWDNILIDTPIQTERFLRAIYGSYQGVKAGANSLFNDFLNHFPEFDNENLDVAGATGIQDKIARIEKDVAILRKLSSGIWPYEPRLPIEHWDRNRLHLLIHALDHIECLPFLLAASLLDHKEFSKIVQTLERFVFRYATICNEYIGDLITIYHEESVVLRNNATTYTVNNLKQRLQPLEAKVSDDLFSHNLDNLKYHQATGKSNKPLKYFLLALEYHTRWIAAGARGLPECLDKERVYDFPDSTIEHVYPHHAEGTTIDNDLEPLKNHFGNLTILGNRDNRTGGNDNFETKRGIYAASSLSMNKDYIATKASWNKPTIETRILEMKEMACKIFKI